MACAGAVEKDEWCRADICVPACLVGFIAAAVSLGADTTVDGYARTVSDEPGLVSYWRFEGDGQDAKGVAAGQVRGGQSRYVAGPGGGGHDRERVTSSHDGRPRGRLSGRPPFHILVTALFSSRSSARNTAPLAVLQGSNIALPYAKKAGRLQRVLEEYVQATVDDAGPNATSRRG